VREEEGSNERGEAATSYKTNWLSLRNNRLKFKTAGKLPVVLEELVEYAPPFYREKLKMSTMEPVGLGSTGMSTDYAQKSISARTLEGRSDEMRPTFE
jgi:hypothetical protein